MDQVSDITIVLDRSGSMESIRESTIKGLNDFITRVRETPGEGSWTFVQFDDEASAKGANEAFPHYVFESLSDKDMAEKSVGKFVPRGSTALVDALYVVLERLKEKYAGTKGVNKPKVLVVVITDGQENASVKHNSAQLRQLTAELQQEPYCFEFLYLGANQDAFSVTSDLGMAKQYAYKNYAGGQQFNNAVQYTSKRKMSDQPVLDALEAGNTISDFAEEQIGIDAAFIDTANKARAWKLEGNTTAENLMGSGDPDITEEKK